MNRFIYSLIWLLALPLVLLYFAKRMLGDKQYSRGFWQRFGFIPKQTQPCYHIHCASLGEVNALAELIKSLIHKQTSESDPIAQIPIVITNTTPAGANRVKQLFDDQVVQYMAPLDIPWITQLFCRQLNSRLSVFAEVEIWPNWLHTLKQNPATQLMLVNARLSERSFKKYQKRGSLFKNAFNSFNWIGAQTAQDAKRYQQLSATKVVVSGNLKFDLSLPENLYDTVLELKQQHALNRPIWIAGSVHPNEYQMIISAHKALLAQFPDALLVIVPRHKERFQAVADYLSDQNLSFKQRSLNTSLTESDHVWLVDTIGELMLFYALADIAFVGGSLVNKGGHNPLEPAALGKPILMGESQVNCQQITDLLTTQGALFTVKNTAQIAQKLMSLLNEPTAYQAAVVAAKKVVEQNKGAVNTSLEMIARLDQMNQPINSQNKSVK